MSSSSGASARHLFALHTAIRLALSTFLSSVRALDTLAPDAHLHNLDRRLERLTQMVLSHCRIEDNVILPVLRDAANRNAASSCPTQDTIALSPAPLMSTDGKERPSKRPRGPPNDTVASPVSVQLQCTEHQHREQDEVFRALRASLTRLRVTPLFTDSVRVQPLSCSGGESQGAGIMAVMSRKQAVIEVREKAEVMDATLRAHMLGEENLIEPSFDEYLSAQEQGDLLVQCMLSTASEPNLPDAFRFVPEQDVAALFSALASFASISDLRIIGLTFADVMTHDRWASLCEAVPQLIGFETPLHNPLIEIIHLHKVLEQELTDLVAYCESIDLADRKQVQALSTRFAFLRRVHSCHADGEDSVLIKELHVKLQSSPCSPESAGFHDNHDDGELLFEQFASRLSILSQDVSTPRGNDARSRILHQDLISSLRKIADHLVPHMREEEAKLFPLVRKHFSLEDQDQMMRRVMGKVPADFLHELIPWMFGHLSVDEQEAMLRNIIRSAPQDEIQKVVGALAQSVQKGMTDRIEWNELLLRVPEIEVRYKGLVDQETEQNIGPVSEILRVHKAFRIELHAILRRSKTIAADGSVPNPRTLVSLAESVAFLRKMVEDHSHAEDEILLPRLEKRVIGISAKYKDDHCDERKLFKDLAKCLEELQCAGDEPDCVKLVQKLHHLARVLRDEMIAHLTQEEEQMWPHVTKHFTKKEQSEIVALIFGQIPGSRLRELLPWMIRILSVSERHTMMNHILQVTQSTMFETWLKTWLPLDDDNSDSGPRGSLSGIGRANLSENCLQHSLATSSTEAAPVMNTAMMLLNGRENIERTMRSIARDSSLSVEDRTRMMQQVMLAPYNENRAGTRAAHGQPLNVDDNLKPTFTADKTGAKRLGCKHYLRACKLRAACCNRLYTCRLCHDDSEQTHIMDRTLTSEIMCMHCSLLQPVSAFCINESCRERFSRYFCEVCVFYDDGDRSIYHCHSCNVCRVGKGLGQDFFHCMKCNQCMSMKYREKGHVCVEKAMESDCPVCHQYLFTSTSPVKHLRCGHVMHMSCFKAYQSHSIKCPLCSRSLEEMTPLFQQLDKRLSSNGMNSALLGYQSARCDIFCLDCDKVSNTAYHFIYNKCPNCNSYNTRVDRVDPRT